MTRFTQNFVAAVAAVLICTGSFAAVVTVPTDTPVVASLVQTTELA